MTAVSRALALPDRIADQHWTAAGLFALLVLVYLWSALVEGDLLAPTALAYSTAPWGEYPRASLPYVNPDLGDVVTTYYPWNALARELLHAGTFPAWNPYAFGGTPLFANAQLAWFSPFSLPLWILPLHTGLGIAAALKLWAAGFGAYLLGRELRLGFWAAMVAGVSFALCAFNVVWLSYGIFVSVAAMLPWALWLTERIVRRGGWGDGLALTAVIAVAMLGGHPGTQVHLLAATALYALVRTVAATGGRDERLRRLAPIGAAYVVGILLSAVVLIPAAELAADTWGMERRMHGAPEFRSSQIPFDALRTAAFPEWWGRPSDQRATPGPASYKERTFYAGAATLLLAGIALASRRGWGRMAPFALLGALGLAISLRAPGLYWLVVHLPGFDRIQNGRILLWFLLAIAMLGGFGLQRLLDQRGRLGKGWALVGGALLAAAIAIATLDFGGGAWGDAVGYVLRRAGTSDATAIALASVIWFVLFAGALAAIALAAGRLGRLGRGGAIVGGLVALVVALDLLHHANGYQPIGPAEITVPRATPAIAFLQRQGDRIAGLASVDADWTTVYRLRDVRGFDDPRPTLRHARLLNMVDDGEVPISFAAPTDAGLRIMGMLGARYILGPPDMTSNVPAIRAVYEGEDAKVFRNVHAIPRVTTPVRVRVARTEEEEFATVADDGFDAPQEAVVRADEVGAVELSRDGGGSAEIVGEENASVTVRATLPAPGLVVLNDTWDKGWRVEVDGRPARSLQVDVVLRGVVVPAGTHTIVWRYSTPGLRAGAALSGVGLLACACWGVLLMRRRRAARSPAPPAR